MRIYFSHSHSGVMGRILTPTLSHMTIAVIEQQGIKNFGGKCMKVGVFGELLQYYR